LNVLFRPITLGAYKHETDFEEKRTKQLATIQTGRAQVQVGTKHKNGTRIAGTLSTIDPI